MRKLTRAPLLLACLCAASLTVLASVAGAREGTGSHHPRQGSVWVVNRDAGEVTVFDARSGDVQATVPTGPGAHEVAISRRTRQAYVTNELGEHHLDPVHADAREPKGPARAAAASRGGEPHWPEGRRRAGRDEQGRCDRHSDGCDPALRLERERRRTGTLGLPDAVDDLRPARDRQRGHGDRPAERDDRVQRRQHRAGERGAPWTRGGTSCTCPPVARGR